jgi:hypothetical protein
MTPWIDRVPRPREGLFVIGSGGRDVAVPVTTCPMKTSVGTVTEKVTSPLAFVVTVAGAVLPRKTCPSPFPEVSHAAFAKNCRRNCEFGVLLSVPWIVVVPAPGVTAVMTGKFWSPLAPVSGSPGVASFGVTPSSFRSMPREPLEKIELPKMAMFWAATSNVIPF